MEFNSELTQTDAQSVLLNTWPVFQHRIDFTTLSRIAEGYNLVFTPHVSVPSCSCEYVATQKVWTSRLSQHQQQIIDIAYPPVVNSSRGRKKKQ